MNKIRRATEADIPGILKLLVQVDMVHHNGRPDIFKGPATKYNKEELLKIINDDTTPVFVCVNPAGDVLGHAFCIHQCSKESSVLTDISTLYVDDICVDEAIRGSGIGRSLYEAVISYAGEHGFYNVTLNVWCCNPNAMAFYENMGMKPQKIGMEKILGEVR